MSGIDVAGRWVRKGAADAIGALARGDGGSVPPELEAAVAESATSGRHAARRRRERPRRSASST